MWKLKTVKQVTYHPCKSWSQWSKSPTTHAKTEDSEASHLPPMRKLKTVKQVTYHPCQSRWRVGCCPCCRWSWRNPPLHQRGRTGWHVSLWTCWQFIMAFHCCKPVDNLSWHLTAVNLLTIYHGISLLWTCWQFIMAFHSCKPVDNLSWHFTAVNLLTIYHGISLLWTCWQFIMALHWCISPPASHPTPLLCLHPPHPLHLPIPLRHTLDILTE